MTAIAVAGAGGFIGSHVVEQLVAANHRVVALDRPSADLSVAEAAGAELRQADLLDEGAAEKALEGCERVINATGLFDLRATDAELDRINAHLARRVATAARRVGARRFVHISSVAVYGKPTRQPMPEDGDQRPSSPYERSKQRGEQAILAEHRDGLEVAVLRPTLVYGPRSTYGQAMMIAMAAQAKALGVDRLPLVPGGPLGHHVHVEDVARASELLSFHPDAAGRCFNVADGHPLPFGDSLLTIAKACGMRGFGVRLAQPMWRLLGLVSRHLPNRALNRLNGQLARGHRALKARGYQAQLTPRFDKGWLAYLSGDYVFDTQRLSSLGFEPKHGDFRQSITDVIDWYRQQQWIAS